MNPFSNSFRSRSRSRLLPAVTILIALTATHPKAAAQAFTDDDWLSLTSEAELGAVVFTSALDNDGNLYVGGNFTSIDGAAANRIARWDGRQWSPLGLGLGEDPAQIPPSVRAIAISGPTLFAGGTFLTAGGQEAWYLAKWDGNNWSGFGRSVGSVSALLADGDDLYVAAGFNFGDGPTGSTLMRWDGKSWHELGDFKGLALALVLMNGDLYVGGSSMRDDATDLNNIAKWDGSNWSSLGEGTDDRVNALAVAGNDLYVGGWFERAGGVAAANYMYHVSRWDGTSWNQLRTSAEIGVNHLVYSLAVHGDDLIAGGTFGSAGGTAVNDIARWNGTAWSPLGSGTDNVPQTLLVDGDKLYVGGNFTTAGGKTSPSMALAYLNGIPPLEISPLDDSVRVFFRDLDPGDYLIQRRDSFSGAGTWTTLATLPADENGMIIFVDENPPVFEAYYQVLPVPD